MKKRYKAILAIGIGALVYGLGHGVGARFGSANSRPGQQKPAQRQDPAEAPYQRSRLFMLSQLLGSVATPPAKMLRAISGGRPGVDSPRKILA